VVHQLVECWEQGGPVSQTPRADSGDDSPDGRSHQRLWVTKCGNAAVLDILLDVGVKRVKITADVVLEEQTGHGTDTFILGFQLGQDVDQVVIVLGRGVEGIELLL